MAERSMLGRTVGFQGALPNGEEASFSGVVSMQSESGSQVGVEVDGFPELCWLPASDVEIVEGYDQVDWQRQRVNCLLGSHRRYSAGDQEAITAAVRDLLKVAAVEDSVDLGQVMQRVWSEVSELGPRMVSGEQIVGIPGDVAALIAATFSRDADTIEAVDSTWEKLHTIFNSDLAPRPDEDGITRIEAQS